MIQGDGWIAGFRQNSRRIILSLVFLAVALVLNYVAGTYTEKVGVTVAPDLILDNIPSVNLSFLYIYGYALIIAVFFIFAIHDIRRFHWMTDQFAFLVIVRSFFISLTHLSTPAHAITVKAPYVFHLLVFTNDLFFSGHTAVPFLGYLIFRHGKIGFFFLVSTIVMASTVLLMHVHYSIDVFAAFFITYGTYRLCSTCMGRPKPATALQGSG